MFKICFWQLTVGILLRGILMTLAAFQYSLPILNVHDINYTFSLAINIGIRLYDVIDTL